MIPLDEQRQCERFLLQQTDDTLGKLIANKLELLLVLNFPFLSSLITSENYNEQYCKSAECRR